MQGYFLSEALAQAGDQRDAAEVSATTSAIAKAAHLEDLFRPPPPSAAIPLPESGADQLPTRPIPQKQGPITK